MNLRRFSPTRSRVPILALAALSSPAAAQVADQGTLIIRSGGKDIGAETFQVTPSATGFKILSRATYVGRRPVVELTGNLDRGSDADLAFQLKRTDGTASGEVYAVLKRNRLTVRRVERGAEQASESPGGPGLVLLADSLFALYLQVVPLATAEGRELTAVLPQTVRRLSFTAQRIAGSLPDASIVRLSGGLQGDIELGPHGEVLRISLPALGLEAVRKRN